MHETSAGDPKDGQKPVGAVPAPASGVSDTGANDMGDTLPPSVESPPTQPHSPWWTAPAGKAVNIPDFGHMFVILFATLRDTLLALFAPAPQPIPIRIRNRR